MEAESTSHNHVYEHKFNSKKYLDTFYAVDPNTQEIDKESMFTLTFMNDVFSSGRVKGKTFIEIGAGPCIYNTLSACERFQKIYLTDYFQGNLDEIKKWLNGENEAFDWSPYLRFVCDLENNGSTPKEKEEKIRRAVSLMTCDVTLSNPLQPNALPLSDCVLSASCLICACKTFADFKMGLKNIVSLVKPGGHLIMTDYLGASHYSVGEENFSLLSLNEDIVREAVAESGCKIEEFQTFKDLEIAEEVFDCKSLFCLLAQKL
ncbi:nicotinamide N-methyltransferase-like [Anomaloglossus baeobatrachus]|uniref:nicotinamide N-methyltransferase-like n=1 Tax=Anomaloglossus baeobatrachus TaxID=238106 RepID=UPI003F4F556E